jgi:hypothetical protein
MSLLLEAHGSYYTWSLIYMCSLQVDLQIWHWPQGHWPRGHWPPVGSFMWFYPLPLYEPIKKVRDSIQTNGIVRNNNKAS